MPSDLWDPARVEMVDLFAGPGGLDVAARWLGVRAAGVELDDNACATRDAAELWTEPVDVRSLGPADFPRATILVGGPPCQTFSVAGAGAGRRALDQVRAFVERMSEGEDVRADLQQLEDERTGLVLEPLRWALEAMDQKRAYRTIVLEQVPAVLPVWEAVGQVLEARGYRVCPPEVLHTEDFGVPQTRRRAILVAHLDREPELPEPTHRRFLRGVSRSEGNPRLSPWRTMADVLSRTDDFVLVSNYGTGGNPRLRGRRTSAEPAYTVTGKVSRNRLITRKGRELERLSLAEAGCLQTFPRDYPWSGKDRSQQIGNAIPPRLAVHVLAMAIFGKKPEPAALEAAVAGSWKDAKADEHLLRPDVEVDLLQPTDQDEVETPALDLDLNTVSV